MRSKCIPYEEPKNTSTIAHLHSPSCALLVGNNNLTVIDSLDDQMRVLAVNGASDRLGSAEDLLDAACEVLGEGLVGHLTGDL